MKKSKEKDFDIEKALYPQANELVITEDSVSALILDEELDPINCSFNNDGCVELDISDYSYLTLSVSNLKRLIELIEQSESYYKSIEDVE